jgi:hypothetical protein
VVHPSTLDSIDIGKDSLSLTYTTNDDYKEYSAIIAEEFVDTSRIVSVNTRISAGETATLEITNEQTFKYVNSGGSKTYDLILQQRGIGTGDTSFTDLIIGNDETHIVKVIDWDHLDTTEIILEIDQDNDGTIDEVRTLRDLTPPVGVADLSASNPTLDSIKLAWTAPGDDGNEGTATTYDIRYSTEPITNANWDSASQVDGEPAPQPAGSAESFTVTDLEHSTRYYFAIKTADEVPNWSGLSNVATAATWDYIFEDPCRKTILKINTVEKTFQFVAPNKEYPVKKAKMMMEFDWCGRKFITIKHWDSDIRLNAEALTGKWDFCFAKLHDRKAKKHYLLIDPPGIE